jgi:tetratricopeptide (TPR) repeat protein
MAHKKIKFIKCTICGASLRSEKLLQHKARAHAELLSEGEKALLKPKYFNMKKSLPEDFAKWYVDAEHRYLNEKRILNGTIEHSTWSCITSAFFEAAREIEAGKIAGKINYESIEFKSKILKLLVEYKAISIKRLEGAKAGRERAEFRENLEVATRAVKLAEVLSFKEICIGVMCYLDGDIVYPEGLEAAYREALAINPYNVAARGNLAMLLEREGKVKEAQREYEKLLK